MEKELKNKYLYSADKPLKDTKDKLIEEGQKIKILVSRHNFVAGTESEVKKIVNEEDNVLVWAAVRPGISTYLNPDNSKDYEIIN